MKAIEVSKVLGQVKIRFEKAEVLFWDGEYDEADAQLAELRDVLDDIYDRPDEDVKARIIAAARQEIPRQQP